MKYTEGEYFWLLVMSRAYTNAQLERWILGIQ